jgi:hypothetical protein
LYVPLSVVAAYLLGMLAVPTEAAHSITANKNQGETK